MESSALVDGAEKDDEAMGGEHAASDLHASDLTPWHWTEPRSHRNSGVGEEGV